jgi:alkyl hydroperoxide reductase subunit AhpC
MKALTFGVLALGLALVAPISAADLNVGDQAPNFTLQGTDGKTYKLSDFKGKQAVVLAWYPAAFTAGCTIECKSLAENGHLIKKYDVTYFMASTDALEGEKGNIDKDGKIAFIDKEVSKRLQTSAQDMATKLAELKVAEKHH